MTHVIILLLFATALFPPIAWAQQTPRQTGHDFRVGYLEYLPPGYATAQEKFPVMIFLHGGGETGDGSVESLTKVKAWGPPSFLDNYDLCFTLDGKKECFIVLSPQLNPQLFDWRTTVDRLLDHMMNGPDAYKYDPDRIYLTGLSRGGLGVYQYSASSYNIDNKLAAIAPIAAWSENTMDGCIISGRKIPVWAFHGQLDTVVPIWLGQAAFNGIQNCVDPSPVAPLIFTTYPDRYHDSWIPAYDPSNTYHSPNVYEWLLKQKRPEPDAHVPTGPVTSVREIETVRAWSVYPNPARDEISITLPQTVDGFSNIKILTLTGEQLMASRQSDRIDISRLPAGAYILQTETAGIIANRRFMKVK